MNIPVLMITWNRLEYTKKAVAALMYSYCGRIYVIDNGSTDGTIEYLNSIKLSNGIHLILNKENRGIAGAMNQFLDLTKDCQFVAKVDNDTVVPFPWLMALLPHMEKCDIVQAKHHIIPATHPDGWDGFVKDMPELSPGLYKNHFVGGSGILFKRGIVDEVPETEWMLGGWREFQRRRPELIKAFCSDVEIKLLDEHGYDDYPEYYITTKRLKDEAAH